MKVGSLVRKKGNKDVLFNLSFIIKVWEKEIRLRIQEVLDNEKLGGNK